MPRLRLLTITTLAAVAALVLASGAATSPGDLDPSFGAGGIVTTDLGGSDGANAVAVQGDGKIVVAGFGPGGFSLVRYMTGGSLDPSFGTGGVVTTFFRGNDGVQALVIQPDGKIVAAGSAGGFGDFALARYNPDGTLDASFGAGGKVTTGFPGRSSAFGVALQGDGKIVAAGQGQGGFFDLARYNLDGTLDPSFGAGGLVQTSFGSGGSATSVAIQADGKIVAAGGSSTGFPSSDFGLARYNPDGTLDPSFGVGGKVVTDFGLTDSAIDLAIQPGGKLIAAGYSMNFSDSSAGGFALARYNPDGSLDTGFGTGGEVVTYVGAQAAVGAIALQPDGKIVAAGSSTASATNSSFVVTRYNGDGTLDVGFGSGGTVTTDVTPGFDNANAVALQADGRIVAAGPANGYANYDFAVVRYLAGGDTVPPVLTVPGPLTVDATGPAGAVVTFTVSAVDAVDGPVQVTCDHASGATFAIGTTTVECTASDAAGNSSHGSFTVEVKGASEQLTDLAAAVKGVGPGKSLAATVATAQWLLARGQTRLACVTLAAFNLEVRAQSGKSIPKAQATALVADSNRIRAVLGC